MTDDERRRLKALGSCLKKNRIAIALNLDNRLEVFLYDETASHAAGTVLTFDDFLTDTEIEQEVKDSLRL